MANADVRDRVSLTLETGEAFRRRLESAGVRQSLTLSTCNRCEVFFWGDDGASDICRAEFVGRFPAAAACLLEMSGTAALT